MTHDPELVEAVARAVLNHCTNIEAVVLDEYSGSTPEQVATNIAKAALDAINNSGTHYVMSVQTYEQSSERKTSEKVI
jgi:hypothetical protein